MENYEKKYKEALSWAHSAIKAGADGMLKEDLERIFPELRESEDERIRKEIIQSIQDNMCVIHKDKCLAWLEKQAEQKPVKQDTEIHDLWVYICEWNDKFGRLPKDEDELASCIDYVMKRQKPSDKVEQSCYHNDGLYYAIDILEKTFGKVEGYQSDDGVIEHQTAIETVNALYHKKPAWSEEDKHCIELLLPIIDSSSLIPKNRKKCKNFLKSLKPNHWKPSEEQMQAIKYFIDFHRPQANASTEGWKEFENLERLYNNLLKL